MVDFNFLSACLLFKSITNLTPIQVYSTSGFEYSTNGKKARFDQDITIGRLFHTIH